MNHLLRLKPKLPKWIWFKIIRETEEPWAFSINWSALNKGEFFYLIKDKALPYRAKKIDIIEKYYLYDKSCLADFMNLAAQLGRSDLIIKYDLYRNLGNFNNKVFIDYSKPFMEYVLNTFNKINNTYYNYQDLYKISYNYLGTNYDYLYFLVDDKKNHQFIVKIMMQNKESIEHCKKFFKKGLKIPPKSKVHLIVANYLLENKLISKKLYNSLDTACWF